MPKIRLRNIPLALFDHLLDRVRDREISKDQLLLLQAWLRSEPDAPAGKWFKRFPGLIVCGEGELIKTFLRLGQVPVGEEMR